MADDKTRLAQVRGAAALVVPWALLPVALALTFRPLLDAAALMSPIAMVGMVCLAGLLPAGVLRLLEVRVGSTAAAGALAAGMISLALAIATTAGVGPWAPVIAALMQVSAYGFGRRLAERLGLDEPTESAWPGVVLCIALGWAGLLILLFIAGTFGWLVRPLVAMVYLAGIILAVPGLRRRARAAVAPAWRGGGAVLLPPSDPASTRPSIVWWWGLSLLLLIGYIGAVAPEVRHDALAAHLPIAREFATRHAIVEMRHNAASYFQINAGLVYASAMALIPDERLPKLLHFASGVTAVLAVYGLGARLWTPSAGLAAAALLAGTPLVWWLAGTVYTDLWTALFSVASVHAALLYVRQPAALRAFGVGLLAGAAVGVKISSAVIAVPLCGVLLARARRERRVGAALTALIAGAVLTGAYSYARAWVLVGNPVFPLLRPIFGSSGGSPETQMLRPLLGMGAGLWDLVLLPWRVTRFPERFVEDGILGGAYLALLPLAAIVVIRRRVPGWISATLVLAVLAWFWTSQYLRFALPMLPLVALVAGAGVAAVPGGKRGTGFAALVLSVMLILQAGAWAASGPPNFPYAVAQGHLTRFDYSARHIRGFMVADFARRALPQDARIIGVGEDFGYHYQRFFVPFSWYGRRYVRGLYRLMVRAQSGSELRRSLAAMGFTHLVADPDERTLWRGRERNAWVTREAFWEEDPRLEYAAGGVYLFALTGASGPRTRGPAVLEEPAPFVTGGSRGVFEVGVEAGRLYALEALVRSTGEEATGQMAIYWYASDGRALAAATARRWPASIDWQRRAVASTAPPAAHRAIIAVSSVAGSPIEVKNVAFYTLR